MARDIRKGQRVVFKRAERRYGPGAVVTGIEVAISRPYGTRTTLVDMVTDTGIQLQWPLSWTRRLTKEG